MNGFDPKSLIDLDQCVLNALNLFMDPGTEFPKPDLGRFQRPLVVGSGNAIATGRIIFDTKDAVYADESSYQAKLEAIRSIDGVVLLSASGGKHAPIIAKNVKASGREIILFTCNPAPRAKDDVNEVHVFPSASEPYTYNTSTYMGMLMACLIGLIPESGPHLVFVTMYAQHSIPFGVLLASSVVQDGHGLLPLLAHSRRAFITVKGVNFLFGLAAGAAAMRLGSG